MASRHRSSSSRRPRCGQCGSRRFRRDPNTGLVICQEGHVLQGYREEEVQEDGDFVNVSSQKRYTRKGDRGKRKKGTKEVYGRDRGSFLIYECLQLILRLQLKALRQEWPGLPPEIEAIARDLWSMFVSMVPSLKPNPYSENLEFMTDQLRIAREESRVRSTSRSRSRSRGPTQSAGTSEEQLDMEQQMETEEEEQERRLEEEIRRIQGDPESDAGEELDPRNIRNTSPPLSRAQSRSANEPMLALAAIIYLSLITARIPVLWGDLRCLFASNRIPFLSAASILPSAMTAKLPENELRRIEMDSVPAIYTLQQRTLRLATDLTRRFSKSIQFPELNAPSVTWRCVQDMGLPPTFYEVALALLTYLGIPLAVVPAASVGDPWSLLGSHEVETSEPQHPVLPPLSARLNISCNPPFATRCTIIMGAVVVAAKMRYGLDGLDRFVESSPLTSTSDVPPLDQWLQALSESQQQRRRDPYFAYELAQQPSLLSGAQIDSLLDFAEESLTEISQPNVRSVWQKEEVDGLFGDRLPPRNIPRCVRPYDYTGEDAPPPRQSLLAAQSQWRQKLHTRLYPLKADEDTIFTSTKTQPLRPGEAYLDPSVEKDEEPHPYVITVLRQASMCVGLSTGGDDDDDDDAGWKEMGEVVRELEHTLIKRLRKEVRLSTDKPVSVMIDRSHKKKRGRPRKTVQVATGAIDSGGYDAGDLEADYRGEDDEEDEGGGEDDEDEDDDDSSMDD